MIGEQVHRILFLTRETSGNLEDKSDFLAGKNLVFCKEGVKMCVNENI